MAVEVEPEVNPLCDFLKNIAQEQENEWETINKIPSLLVLEGEMVYVCTCKDDGMHIS